MSVRSLVLPNRYLDSVALLRLSGDLLAIEGIDAATAVMATASNLDAAREVGLDVPDGATPSDLYVGVRGTDDACDTAIETATRSLTARNTATGGAAAAEAPRSIGQHVRTNGEADLALISVPGAFAAAEARKALDHGMHAMVFSDNVALHDEIELKQLAARRGLLVMGPDCGTSIIGGVSLGFANVVRRGPIAVVGASGTGMQEVISRIHRLGGGVSEAIGCGGRDLSADVGAITMTSALSMLASDHATDVIVLVSKPPAPEVLATVIDAAKATGKHVVAVFVGLDTDAFVGTGIVHAATLADAADLAVALQQGRPAVAPTPRDIAIDGSHRAGSTVRGAFVGGTFCYEADHLLELAGVHDRELIDFGDDEYTVGRPHPMIDPAVRDAWAADALADPTTAVLLLDVVLGHGSHAAPIDGLLSVLARATADASSPLVIAHVCGTELDPQPRAAIIERLTAAGVLVADSNAEAARLAAAAVIATAPPTDSREAAP